LEIWNNSAMTNYNNYKTKSIIMIKKDDRVRLIGEEKVYVVLEVNGEWVTIFNGDYDSLGESPMTVLLSKIEPE